MKNSFIIWLPMALVLAGLANGQSITGQITGRVVDSSGAVVSGAQVAVTNTGTGVERRAESNDEGYYTVPLLPPGSYRIGLRKEGFRPALRSGIDLKVDQVIRLDFTLEVGAVTETIEVRESAPVVESQSGAIGTVVEGQSILSLPLNARNTFRLTLLAPGVTEARNFGDSFNGSSRFSVNGSRPMTADIMIDGISNATPGAFSRVFVAIFPTPDSLQEFKIQTNSFSAEFGRTGGGLVNMVMKSGTNQFHGSLYEFLRNSRMDANDFFSNSARRQLGSFKRNQFGGTAGGPMVRNKAFFFLSYEGLRQRSLSTGTYTVPTVKERAGDYSASFQTVGANCLPVQVFDPLTTQAASDGRGFVRAPFAGNVIPSARRDRVGENLMKYYPQPNLPGAACSGANNYFASSRSRYDTNQYDGKFDWAASDRNRLFAGLSRYDNLRNTPNHYGTIGDTQGSYLSDETMPARAARIDYTRVQTPTFLVNVRGGAVRWERTDDPFPAGFRLSDIGLPQSLQEQMSQPVSFPIFTAAGFSNLGNSVAFTYQVGNTYTASGSATWLRHAHNMKFGGEFRVFQSYEYSGFSTSGAFSFTRSFTQGPDPNVAGTNRGHSIASMLLGTGSGSVQRLPPVFTSNRYGALFFQDNIKLGPRLNLDAGLRYEVEPGRHERFQQASYWDFTARSPLADRVQSLPNLRGGLRFVGKDAPSQYDTDWNNFAPRFGLAFTATPRTILRAGYGVFYTQFVGMAIGGAAGTNGFLRTTEMVGSIDGLNPLNYLANPFPGGLLKPTGNTLGLLTNAGQPITAQRDGAIDRGSRVGYMQQWNFNIQRQAFGSLLLEAAYVGSKGTKLPEATGWELNQLDPQYLSLGPALQQRVSNPFFGVIQSGALAQPETTRAQLLRPYPQFLGIIDWWPAAVMSVYHGVQLRAQQQFRSGASYLFSYTAGKNIDDQGGYQNAYNRRAERSLSTEDISQRLVASFVYELPFGRGRHFGPGWPAWLSGAIGNWQTNGIWTMSTGYPLAITAQNNAGLFNAVLRPNIAGDPKLDSGRSRAQKIARWFNTTAFAQPAPFTFGSGSRTLPTVRSDSIRNVDFSLFKVVPIREKLRAEIRGEFFNLFNRPQMGIPGQAMGSGAFGVVSSQANIPRQVQLGLKVAF